MRKSTLALAAFAALSAAAPAGAATTLISENFNSGLGVFTATGQVGINTGNGYNSCCQTTGSAANMSNPFVAFGSNNQPSGTLTSPTFDFLVGETYTVDFDFGELGAGTEILTILLGSFGTVTVSKAADDNLDTTFSHVHASLTVFSNAGPGTVRISSSGGNNVDSILDNFVLTTTANVSSVPEPGTWAMMLVGFAGIGAALRRRKIPALAKA